MSAQETINLVDDEEMRLQGSVNAPMAPPSSPMVQGPTYQTPSGLPPWPGTPMAQVQAAAVSAQQSVAAGPSGGRATTIVPVQSTEVIAVPTVPVDAPTRQR